jgi:hypothetical protein
MAPKWEIGPVALGQAHQLNIEVAGALQLRTTDGDMLQSLNAQIFVPLAVTGTLVQPNLELHH